MELVECTKIPRTKIYADLKILETKKWIIREEIRPIRYYAVSSEGIYRKVSISLQDRLFETETHLINKWDERKKFTTK